MACKDKCELVDWWVGELVSYSLDEGPWEQAVGLGTVRRDPPCGIVPTPLEVLLAARYWLAQTHGIESFTTKCGRDCRCVRIGPWVLESTGLMGGKFDLVLKNSDVSIRGMATVTFEAKVEKRRAPGTCISVRLSYKPHIEGD